MSGISTGIGLISGIDTATLINQLLAIEARPKVLAIGRQIQLQNEQAAFLGLNSLLLSLKSAAEAFGKDKTFRSTIATSSASSVLSASTTSAATSGNYTFIVNRLVTNSQLLSRGFADSDSTAVGATNISFEFGNGRLTTETRLTELNGGAGVGRGKIRITDSQSNSAVIDLSTAVSIDDVLDAINGETSLLLEASVSDDGSRLILTDDAAGAVTVENVSGYNTGTDLGLVGGSYANGVLTGTSINALSANSQLASLNDGNGVNISHGLDVADFRIRTRDGVIHNIILGERTVGPEETEPEVTNLQGVIDRIDDITGGDVTAAIASDGVSLQLTDNTGASTDDFAVLAGTLGDQTARDLGILKTADVGTPTAIAGDRLLAGINSVLVKSLNGGIGLAGNTSLSITDRSGASQSFTLSGTASLTDIIAQVNNDATIDVTLTLNSAGNGLLVSDNTGSSISNLIITGNAAASLGLDTGLTGVAASSFAGTNLQLQYVAGSTRLAELNYGRGIGVGSFRITDATGAQALVDIDSDAKTLQDIIAEINSKGLGILARVNDTGDGLLIENTELNPFLKIKVETVTGTTAKDLGILGEAAGTLVADNFIDGAYEKNVELDAEDTLDDIIAKINDAGIDVAAALINDGSGTAPVHISFNSEITGTAGDLLVDVAGADLALTTLSQARDAVVFFGSTDPARAILVTSSSNSLDKLITGVNIDLKSTSDTPVQLSITQDTQGMIDTVKKFIDTYNAVINRIGDLDSYDSDTDERGILLGNATISRIRSQLSRTIQGPTQGVDTEFTRLNDVGIRIGEGGKLVLDEDRLRTAIVEDREAVENLFAAKKLADDQTLDLGQGITAPSPNQIFDSLGLAEQIVLLAGQMTNTVDGALTLVGRNYDDMIQLQQKRIDDFDIRLEAKRQLLQRNFAAMESALAALQSQGSALSSITFIGQQRRR